MSIHLLDPPARENQHWQLASVTFYNTVHTAIQCLDVKQAVQVPMALAMVSFCESSLAASKRRHAEQPRDVLHDM